MDASFIAELEKTGFIKNLSQALVKLENNSPTEY